MAKSSLNQPRAVAPRRLEQKESLQSLNHWRSVFRNYYRRCQYYGLFLLPTTTWDNSQNRGFTEDETTGLKRDIQTLAADLNGFLDCIGCYLPFDYVSDKRILEIPSNCILQTESDVSANCTENIVADVSQVNPDIACLVCPGAKICSKNATISDYNVHGQLNSDEKLRVSGNKQDLDQTNVGKTQLNKQKSESEFSALLYTLQSSKFHWRALDKSNSPKIECRWKSSTFLALIDSGAEINVLDKDFALSLSIGIVKTSETATAANKSPLEVYGQTSKPVVVECITEKGSIKLHLGVMLVVANLGIKCLLGEPAKIRNNLICLPRHKSVVIANGPDVTYVPYYQDKPKYSVVRAVSTMKLNPGESLPYYLPESFQFETCVAISPRINTIN